MDRLNERTKNIVGWACVGIVVLAVLAGIIYGLWRIMLQVPENTARAWAMVATALLPIVAWVAWKLGHWYAKGIVRGIDWGIGKVAQAGSQAADLRVHIHREMRRDPQQVAVLPDVIITPRQLEGGREIVEL